MARRFPAKSRLVASIGFCIGFENRLRLSTMLTACRQGQFRHGWGTNRWKLLSVIWQMRNWGAKRRAHKSTAALRRSVKRRKTGFGEVCPICKLINLRPLTFREWIAPDAFRLTGWAANGATIPQGSRLAGCSGVRPIERIPEFHLSPAESLFRRVRFDAYRP